MGWRDLLQKNDATLTLPWVGGRELFSGTRTFELSGKLPRRHGWYTFKVQGRKISLEGNDDATPVPLSFLVQGYLVGDRLMADGASAGAELESIVAATEKVWLVEPGIDKFVRIQAGRMSEFGPLIYEGYSFPLGPESDVLNAFLDRKDLISRIPGVTPGLEAAFRLETWQRSEAERIREEIARKRAEEEARLAEEERRAALFKQIGSAQGRRELAKVDFDEAARHALAVGGAEFQDSRDSANAGEKVVRFKIGERRFECTCDSKTLQIIDSGVCLVDHKTNIKGDTRFTLESLPGVIQEAQRIGKLVIFRHADGGGHDYEDDEYDDY